MLERLVELERERWQTRRKTLGWLSALVSLMAMASVAAVLFLYPAQADVPALVVVVSVLFLPQFIAGVALVLGYRWPRAVLWPISVVLLTMFPIGTALGAYGIWVLYNTRGRTERAAEG